MNNTVISVRNIGKKYQLGFTHQRKGYKTLRDTFSYNIRRLISGIRNENLTKNEDDNIVSNNQTKSGEFWALRDISFDVQEGDVVGIIGRNGAGKSTLLKILSQITEPTEGEIRIKGRVASLLEVGTGFHGELSGRENVYMNGAILGMTKAEIKSKFDEIVAFAEVEKFIDTPVKRYSSGMQVRLAFAVAAHLEPEILVVDEVLAVGDMEFQKKCIGKMDKVSKKGRTVLFVSHNMGIISKLCTRGILLEGGRIEEMSEIGSVVRKYLSMPTESGDVDLSSVLNRNGDGTARITRAVTKNGRSKVQDTFMIGDDIVFELHISGGSWVQSGKISLQITSSQGIPIYHLVGQDAGFELSNMTDNAVVNVRIKKQKLYPGEYYVSLWLADRAYQTLDAIGNAFKFSVIEGGISVTRGLDGNSAVIHEVPEWKLC
jgi:lipopolysaccharide transport system ATP-binding protein